GSMDGASKFVRGDAVAGLIITAINIIGGLAIGVLQQGLPITQALETYTLLTIGDGLVTQLPALIVSTASGIVVTRAAAESDLSRDLLAQLTERPRALGTAAGILGGFALVPGLPTLPFLMVAGVLWLAAAGLKKRAAAQKAAAPAADAATDKKAKVDAVEPLDLLSLEVGYNLIPLVDAKQGGDLLERVRSLRRTFSEELGFVVPPVRIRDNLELRPNAYAIRLKHMITAQAEVYPGRLLAMNPGTATHPLDGLEVREPTFGVPATWIATSARDEARAAGYTVVDASTVVATHLSELVRREGPSLLPPPARPEAPHRRGAAPPARPPSLVPAPPPPPPGAPRP